MLYGITNLAAFTTCNPNLMYVGKNPTDAYDQNFENASRSKEREAKPIFNVFGLGILSFFRIQEILIQVFVFASIISCIMMCINATGDGLIFNAGPVHTFLSKTSLGNLGQKGV